MNGWMLLQERQASLSRGKVPASRLGVVKGGEVGLCGGSDWLRRDSGRVELEEPRLERSRRRDATELLLEGCPGSLEPLQEARSIGEQTRVAPWPTAWSEVRISWLHRVFPSIPFSAVILRA
jgi:hypothetical protein